MLTLPDAILSALQPFSTLFRRRTWTKAQILLIGAILSPRKRTVSSALRVMGLSDQAGFAKYHHVLSRAVWSPLKLSRVPLILLIEHLAGEDEPLVFGIDETLERRWGSRISAKGVFRDCGSLHRDSPGQGKWTALGQPDVADPHPLCQSHMGASRSDRSGAGAELPSEDWATAQEDHRLGTTDDLPVAPLAA